VASEVKAIPTTNDCVYWAVEVHCNDMSAPVFFVNDDENDDENDENISNFC